MEMLKQNIIIAIIILLFCRCGKNVSLEGFEEQNWKEDKLGCSGDRDEMVPVIIDQKEKILGLPESKVLQTLGRPDFQELSKRNQKFYFYYLLPGPQCKNGLSGAKEQTLQIKLNSVGYASEILVNRY